ncbi:hypothetical protein CFOL_v3_31852 [Cephalotus follicularis]|uniref:Uncharacterized protein n=1 Tax=Cephalotus follicularis TaxID=3775 RepID=A0A1Q3D7I2_CEPFO|nr:hypothetical protein CFOL_v3_31852 [Cephalotus follicularis]
MFLVVDTPNSYNAIIGRTGLNLLEAIVSTRHLVMKFPTRFGVGEVRGDQQVARQCYKTVVVDKGKEKALSIVNVELRGDVEPERPQPVEEVLQVPLEERNEEKIIQVGSQLGEGEKGELIMFLRNSKDVFAWLAEEVPGRDGNFTRPRSPRSAPLKMGWGFPAKNGDGGGAKNQPRKRGWGGGKACFVPAPPRPAPATSFEVRTLHL